MNDEQILEHLVNHIKNEIDNDLQKLAGMSKHDEQYKEIYDSITNTINRITRGKIGFELNPVAKNDFNTSFELVFTHLKE
jgi:hypothetical protein